MAITSLAREWGSGEEGETGRVGEGEMGRVGEWESGRGGEWERGRVGEWQSRRCGKYTFFPLPSSFFPLPSSFFPLPSSLFLLPSSFFLLPSSFLPLLFHGMSFVESFEALLVADKPPVPRLVTDALAIVFGEGHFKAEGDGVGF